MEGLYDKSKTSQMPIEDRKPAKGATEATFCYPGTCILDIYTILK